MKACQNPFIYRKRHPWLLHDTQERPTEPSPHVIDLLQPPQAAELPEAEHPAGQTTLCCQQQHWL